MAGQRSDLRPLGPAIEECRSERSLLTHTEARHLQRVSAVYLHLSEPLVLS